jgi:quercetin dioxygenase-like cupin family protein
MTTPLLIPFSDAPVLHAFGEEVSILLGGEQTGGAFTRFVETTPPGCGPPPHLHEREDESFYVLEGCVSFFIEGRWIEAHPGDTVFAPRQQVHAFKNNTDQPTQMLIETMPSGFENFFAEAAVEFAKPEGPSMQRALQIAESYGIRFVKEGD